MTLSGNPAFPLEPELAAPHVIGYLPVSNMARGKIPLSMEVYPLEMTNIVIENGH